MQNLLEAFSEVTSFEQTKEMLHQQGHILLAEHSQSYLLLSCLEDEMNGKVSVSPYKNGRRVLRNPLFICCLFFGKTSTYTASAHEEHCASKSDLVSHYGIGTLAA